MSRAERLALTVTVLGLLAVPATAAAPEGSAADVLSKVKEASGGKAWDAVVTMRTKATLATGGMTGPVESWDDVRKGRYVDTVELGPIWQAQGFDGTTLWMQDTSRQVRKDEGGDEREAAANDAYRRSLAYFFPDRWPATMEAPATKEDAGRQFRVVRITPKDGRPFDLWVDTKTWLIDRVIEKAAVETRTTFVSDYRAVQGVRVPFTLRSTNGETKYDQVITLQSVELNLPVEEARFRMPAPPPADFKFAHGAKSTTVPFELINNHIYLMVTLDGKGPFRMLFDTGGANIVTPELARQIGLKTEGALQGRGVGEKSEDVALSKVGSLQVGDVTVSNQVFAIYALGSLASAEGIPQSGLIGYEVLKRFTVRVDYENSRLTLTDPAAFAYNGNGTVVPFRFNGHVPQVDGEIDGIAGKFDIDTGSRASITLLGPFAEKHNLKDRYAARVEAVTGWGVGGAARSLVARAGTLRLGSVQVASPVTELSLQKKGAFVDPYVAGNVGAGVLKRFNIVFDYASQKLIFEPNALGSKPDVFDRSGMWLNQSESGFEVIDVVPGGPAAQAALRTGDRILAVDGKKSSELDLPGIRGRFKSEPAGTQVRLTVRSGEATRDVVLTLKELV